MKVSKLKWKVMDPDLIPASLWNTGMQRVTSDRWGLTCMLQLQVARQNLKVPPKANSYDKLWQIRSLKRYSSNLLDSPVLYSFRSKHMAYKGGSPLTKWAYSDSQHGYTPTTAARPPRAWLENGNTDGPAVHRHPVSSKRWMLSRMSRLACKYGQLTDLTASTILIFW